MASLLMAITLCSYAVELNYTVIVSNDNFNSYTVNQALPCGIGEKWEKSSDAAVWTATVVRDSDRNNRTNKYLTIEKPNANVEADSYSLITSKLTGSALLTGDVDVSFRLQIPSLGVAASGEAYNQRQQNYSVKFTAINGEGKDLLGEGFKLWTNHGGAPKVEIDGTLYELAFNTWQTVRLVFDAETQTASYYINNDTTTPTATKAITESYNMSYFGFRLDKNLPETKFIVDDFNMVHSNTEYIDEATMTIMYMPVYDSETRTITIDGTARPHFDQAARADLYFPADSTTALVTTSGATVEGGAFNLELTVPEDVSGRVLLDVSSDYLPTTVETRKRDILIYSGSADAALADGFSANIASKASTITMLNTFLPLAVSRSEWFNYLDNDDFYATYLMKNAAEGMPVASVADLGNAYDSATVILGLNNAGVTEIVDLLASDGFLDLESLTEDQVTEFNRVWRGNELTEDFTCEKDVKERIDEVMSVTLVNSALRSGISGIVRTYQNTFGLTDAEVDPEGLDFDIVCAPLFGQGYLYPSEIRDAIKASIAEQREQNKGADKDKDKDSGGRGGGGKVSVGIAVGNKKPAIAPETVVVPQQKPATGAKFFDVETHWAKEAILTLCEKQIINGYEDGTFKPEQHVNRAEYIAMAARILKLGSETANFDDVAPGAWYSGVIGAAYKAGLIQGSDNCIFPENTITRQDAAVILYRMLGEPEAVAEETVFADSDSIASYAKQAVSVLSSMGIISGYEGKFEPQREISRAETAKILWSGLAALETR